MYNAKQAWIKHWQGREIEYPAEYLVRIIKGAHPRLNLQPLDLKGKKICDIACGTGANLVFLKKCGFEVYGTEIADEIVKQVRLNLDREGVEAEIRTGTNGDLPFEDNFFDFIVSWNACYYMGTSEKDFNGYVKEFGRILKPGGYAVFSIPQKTCFIFKDSETIRSGYQLIKNDPSDLRQGEILRRFEDEDEIRQVFGESFNNFIFGKQTDDCFGLNYHWHLMVCRKK